MSKQKRGMFRVIAGLVAAMGISTSRFYDDPVLISPENRRRKKRAGGGSGLRRFAPTREVGLGVPPCEPGTITYNSLLTRHFGHKFANDFRRRYIASRRLFDRVPLVIPMEQDFIDNPPWAFLK